MNIEYKGLYAACIGAYEQGLNKQQLMQGYETSLGIPPTLICSVLVESHMYTATTRLQLLCILNDAGLAGHKINKELLAEATAKHGDWKNVVAHVAIKYKDYVEPTPEPIVLMTADNAAIPDEPEVVEEEVLDVITVDEKYIKKIRGEKDADPEAKKKLLEYGAELGIALDARKGFKKMSMQLRKELKLAHKG